MEINPFYDRQPDVIYCGEDRCSMVSRDDSVIGTVCNIKNATARPSTAQLPVNAEGGYTEYNENNGTCENYVVLKKNPYWTGWNNIKNEYLKNKSDKNVIKKVYNCCLGDTIGDSDRDDCGSLIDGIKNKNRICSNILKEYCNDNPEELVVDGSVCYNYAKENPDQINLEKICKSNNRNTNPKWNEICACYKPFSFYENINKTMNEKWGVPLNFMNFQPECIYPQCKISPFMRSKYKDGNICPNPSFTQCVSNVKMNIENSDINDIKINQLPQCMNKYTINKKTTPPMTPGLPSEQLPPGSIIQPPASGGGNKIDKEKKAKKKKQLIIGAGIFLLFIITILMLIPKGKKVKTQPMMYQPGMYQPGMVPMAQPVRQPEMAQPGMAQPGRQPMMQESLV